MTKVVSEAVLHVTVGPPAGLEAVRAFTLTKPVSLVVVQVTVWPALFDAVQAALFTKPVSVVWQVRVKPLIGPLLAVQVVALTKPVSVVWQVICVPELLKVLMGVVAVQDAAFTKFVSVVWQSKVWPEVLGVDVVVQDVAARFA